MAKESPPVQLGRVLAGMRQGAARQGLAAYVLSQRIGMAINTVQRLLDGRVSPSLATLESVAAALGLVLEVRRP